MADEPERGGQWTEQDGIWMRNPADRARFAEEKTRGEEAMAVAEALHSLHELQQGMEHPDEQVRMRVVPRLLVRGKDDPATLPLLLRLAVQDPSWLVRDTIVSDLRAWEPTTREILDTLDRVQREDVDERVRETARDTRHDILEFYGY
jgi:hypothetical protein